MFLVTNGQECRESETRSQALSDFEELRRSGRHVRVYDACRPVRVSIALGDASFRDAREHRPIVEKT
jgi:hypothetical protein